MNAQGFIVETSVIGDRMRGARRADKLVRGLRRKDRFDRGSFALIHDPPISGWQFTSHVFAKGLVDRHAIDIVWFRAVGQRGWLALIPSFGLPCGSSGLALRVSASLRNG